MEITVTVNAPELAGAITKLALAIEGASLNKNGEVTIPAGTTATVQSVEQVVQPTTVAPVAPQQTAPVPQPQAPTPAQQTTAQPQQKALTLNDIATAGAGLVDQGKMQQVIELLGKYGVQAITQLQPTQFDAFAGELRALGAAI
jgi:hypothetical protein